LFSSPGYVRIDYLLRTSDLIKWAYDVANGMEFLASKKIIHGDLAIRNLLLDADQNVKITDFGLSKQMYKYMNNYIVKKKVTNHFN
jgi:serine/threonine protein kinase